MEHGSAEVFSSLPWYRQRHLLELNYSILSLVLLSSGLGYDGTLNNGLLALHQWTDFMHHPTSIWLGFIYAVYLLASALGNPVAAWAANVFGRRIGVQTGFIFLVIGVVLQTSAQHPYVFILSRVFLGFTSACYSICAPLLLNEIATPKHRGTANALFNCGFYVGSLLAAWTTFGTRNMDGSWAWRLPTFLQMALPILAFPGVWLAPESPRWLTSMGREADARDMLTRYHAGGDRSSRLVELEIEQIVATLKAEEMDDKNTGYREMISTPGNRRRLLISISVAIFSQWGGNGVVSYYLTLVLESVGITSVTDQTMLSGFLGLWNLTISILAAFSVERIGRRPLFLASASIMLVSYVIITALSAVFAQTGAKPVGLAVIPMLFVFFAGYDIALTPLVPAYTCEIWPYRLRARGVNVTMTTLAISAMFNALVNPIGLVNLGWKYYIVFIVVLVAFGLTAYFFYPETKGYTLEQIAIVFDGDDAARVSSMAGVELDTMDSNALIASDGTRNDEKGGVLIVSRPQDDMRYIGDSGNGIRKRSIAYL